MLNTIDGKTWFTISLVVLACGIWAAYFIRKRRKATGQLPEGNALKSVRAFARSHSFACIAPALLVRGGKTASLSAVMVGYFGVMGIILLEQDGTIYGSNTQEKWVQVRGKNQREEFLNPVLEASAAVRVLRDALFAAKLKNVPVEVHCVFTNPAASLALPRSTSYLKTEDLKKLLKKEKYLQDIGLDIEKVQAALRAAMPEAEKQ